MPLKLIGAGLGRTGTVSLKLALEQLGLGPCYHMTELFMHAGHAPHWVRAADGHPDWEGIFDGYGSTVDYPGCTFWRELSQFYPMAQVLLSVRDADQWFESTQATIFNEATTATLKGSPLEEFFHKTVWRHFLDRIHDRDFMVEAFQRHNAEVERTIPRDRLLVYTVTQGWEPLCEFLGVPIPDAPFPRANSREDYAQRHAAARQEGRDAPTVAELRDPIREDLSRMRGPD
jgi:Sulfotransferase domain